MYNRKADFVTRRKEENADFLRQCSTFLLFGASAITYKICGTAENASETPGVRRRCMSVIKQTLDEYGIRIPYTQLVLHGQDAQPEDRAGGAS